VLLGFNAVRNAIVSMALPNALLFQDFEMIEFWKANFS